MECPFCTRPGMDVVAESLLAVAVRDGYPVSLGHTLIMTRRHVPDYFHCTDDEKRALWALVEVVQADLAREFAPDGFNVGFNAGLAAGQTVMHVHIHVIPRYAGDVEDPRGGVRYVVPDKANYLRVRDEILTDGENGRGLYASLAPLLPRATRIDILSAFVQDSGLKVIEPAVRDALRRGAGLRIVTGDYLDITQVDALRRLADWSDENHAFEGVDTAAGLQPGTFDCRVVETALLGGRAFHPKAWHLEGPEFGVAFVGSSNLSRSALVDGIEWNLRVDRHRDRAAWNRVGQSFERLWHQGRPLDRDWIAAYAARVRAQPRPFPVGELAPDLPVALPVPNPFQQSALAQLAAARAEGRQRGLVVLATGLGKTLLAVQDIAAWAQDSGVCRGCCGWRIGVNCSHRRLLPCVKGSRMRVLRGSSTETARVPISISCWRRCNRCPGPIRSRHSNRPTSITWLWTKCIMPMRRVTGGFWPISLRNFCSA